ncbi:MAG: 50S ribosomal protein L21 [Candidatus Alcyoniella australis]|nr:50S ribosomal protein L21 [Candidatus Alcyoniella australis]
MYAVLESGGQQLKVAEGDVVKIHKIEAEDSAELVIDKVLMISKDGDLQVGKPYVPNAKVTAEVLGQGRDKKVMVFKKRRRTGFRVMRGHRQPYTEIRIVKIEA